MNPGRLLRLSRAREFSTNAGQYAVGVLMADALHPSALLGLAATLSAGLFVFTFNTLADHQAGQTVENPGKALGVLDAADLRVSRALRNLGLSGALACILLLAAAGGRLLAPAFLLGYLLVGYLYSSPAFRWKGVPGLEVVCNGLAHALPFFAGYLQFRAPDRLSVCYGASFFLFVASYYLLHCVEDDRADRRAGLRNLCGILGVARSVKLAMGGTAVAVVPFTLAATRLPILFIFLPFFAISLALELKMLRTGSPGPVARLRRIGRLYGLALFAVLAVRAWM